MVDVVPHELVLPASSPVRLTLRLHEAGRDEALWDQVQTLRSDAQGVLPPAERVSVPLPAVEGVYDLEVALTVRRRAAPFAAEKLIVRRGLQLVVISERPEPTLASNPPRLVVELDPTQNNWWQRLTHLPQWSLLPGFRSEGPLGNVKTEVVQLAERDWTRLPIGGWQAYPLPIDEVGVPHELELDFPSGLSQTLAISIVEPDAAGKVIPIGLDSGVQIGEEDIRGMAAAPQEPARHRLLFWPRTTSPLVLVTNLRDDGPATFGRFRVTRVDGLPPLPPATGGSRQVIAFFERPLLAECFHAAEAFDPETGRSLEDWRTFYDGGQRLVQYLRHVGYDGLAIACVSEGSALLDSPQLQPTPKHDRGIFFGSGQDPLRKDVAEMLFRLCDREGLTLIPLIEFASPLPALERLKRQAEGESTGVEPVDAQGISWIQRHGIRRGKAVYYNPLDPRVQQAMLDIVREITSRYARHTSFGGVSINLHPDGYTQLPDVDWGLDEHTLSRFQADTGLRPPDAADRRQVQLAAWIQGPARLAWLDWRSQQLAQFYGRMAEILTQRQPTARLYLAGARLVESRPVQRAFQPTLPRQADAQLAMKELGLDFRDLDPSPHLVFLRPQLFALDEPSSNGVSQDFNVAEDVDRYFSGSARSGSQFLHDPVGRRLPTFDELSPFGKANTYLSLVAQVSPAGVSNRRRFVHALSVRDAQVIFEGGWMLPLGQEQTLRELFEVYRQLPAEPFAGLTEDDRATQPLRIRQLKQADTTYLYVLNDSPWQVGASLRLDLPAAASFESLGPRPQQPLTRGPGPAVWNLNLQPYDLLAVRVGSPQLQVLEATVKLPPHVLPALQTRIVSLGSRAAQLRNPPSLKLLSNPGFESPATASGALAGWTVEGDARAVSLETGDVFEGRQALRVNGRGPTVVVRSEPLVPPASGRLSISVRARSSGSGPQPRVRLVLEADGRPYYPWAPIGAGDPQQALSGPWKEFVFRVSQLPAVQSSLKIGVEVTGHGDVWVDDVRLYDMLVLDDQEQKALAHILSLADFQLRKGFVADCLRSLNGYWPRYLMAHVAEATPEVAQRSSRDGTAPQPPQSAPSGWNRVKRFIPRLPRF